MTIWTVYRFDKITSRSPFITNEVRVGGDYATAGEAMDAANELRRADRAHSYGVGEARCA